jgi:hypothetical protein
MWRILTTVCAEPEQEADSREGSVADRRKIHAASMLYDIHNGSVPKLAGTSN